MELLPPNIWPPNKGGLGHQCPCPSTQEHHAQAQPGNHRCFLTISRHPYQHKCAPILKKKTCIVILQITLHPVSLFSSTAKQLLAAPTRSPSSSPGPFLQPPKLHSPRATEATALQSRGLVPDSSHLTCSGTVHSCHSSLNSFLAVFWDTASFLLLPPPTAPQPHCYSFFCQTLYFPNSKLCGTQVSVFGPSLFSLS